MWTITSGVRGLDPTKNKRVVEAKLIEMRLAWQDMHVKQESDHVLQVQQLRLQLQEGHVKNEDLVKVMSDKNVVLTRHTDSELRLKPRQGGDTPRSAPPAQRQSPTINTPNQHHKIHKTDSSRTSHPETRSKTQTHQYRQRFPLCPSTHPVQATRYSANIGRTKAIIPCYRIHNSTYHYQGRSHKTGSYSDAEPASSISRLSLSRELHCAYPRLPRLWSSTSATRRTTSMTDGFTLLPHINRQPHASVTGDITSYTGPSPHTPTPDPSLRQPPPNSEHATSRAAIVSPLLRTQLPMLASNTPPTPHATTSGQSPGLSQTPVRASPQDTGDKLNAHPPLAWCSHITVDYEPSTHSLTRALTPRCAIAPRGNRSATPLPTLPRLRSPTTGNDCEERVCWIAGNSAPTQWPIVGADPHVTCILVRCLYDDSNKGYAVWIHIQPTIHYAYPYP